LADAVKAGTFREDLYYRLNVFPIQVPSLRERAADIPALTDHFIKRFNAQERLSVQGAAKETIDMLSSFAWPGNVRQLENAIFRAMILSDGNTLQPHDFPQISGLAPQITPATGDTLRLAEHSPSAPGADEPVHVLDREGHLRTLVEIERDLIEFAIDNYSGHMSEVARRLGIGRSTLNILGGIIMKRSTLKILALSSAAIAAVAVPVSASHNSQGLRGMFSAHHTGGGAYISQQACNPCGWQAQKLQQRLQSRVQTFAQPTYVTAQTNQMGLRGYSHSHDVRAAHTPQADIFLQGQNGHTQQQFGQLAQLGYGQQYSAYYDPAAAQAFYNDRSFNVGGASVRTSVLNSARMLDWQENTTGKALNLLANRASGVLDDNALYIGGACSLNIAKLNMAVSKMSSSFAKPLWSLAI